MSGATTAVAIGFAALSAVSSISAANSQAKATIAEGNLATQNKAKEVALKAARQKSSFLTSGLTLEGTPMSVIENTFNTGIEDIKALGSNYNSQSKNIMAQGRTKALSSFASLGTGMSMSGSGMFSGIDGAVGNAFNPAYFGDLSNASNLDRYLTATEGL
jgi:hypothetical protein